MEISQNLEVLGLALWLKREKVLIISDLHLGYEEYLHQKGVLLPRTQARLIKEELQKLFQIVKPKIIIINGDLKHEFGTILRQEWKEVLGLVDFLLLHCEELVLVRGNHDTILGPLAEKRGLKMVSEQKVGDTLIIHGDKLAVSATSIKRIIIGHEHPAITLRDKSKVEKFKCFLKGKWKRKELVVMPSFNPLLEGTDILKEKLLSPFLKDISNFEVFVVGETEVLPFGKVKDVSIQ